jgi:hypothetical protein
VDWFNREDDICLYNDGEDKDEGHYDKGDAALFTTQLP